MQSNKNSSGSGSSGSSGKRNHGKTDRAKSGKDTSINRGKQKKKGKFDIAKVRCYNCNEKGHSQSDCPEPRKDKANVAEDGDEDPALLMLEACEMTEQSDTMSEQVFLNEEKMVSKIAGKQETSWYLDTGASNHMTGNPEKFAVEICGRGSILMQCITGEHHVLTEVYFILRPKNNIISLGQLEEIGCKYTREDGVMTIWDKQRKVLARVPRTHNRMYILKIQPSEPVCLLAHAKEEAWLWHMRYVHINFRSLRSLGSEGMVKGMPQIAQVDQICDGCMITKHKRLPFPAQAAFRAQKQLELWHGDLCGPITPVTPGADSTFSCWLTTIHDTCGSCCYAARMKRLQRSRGCSPQLNWRRE
jgi:hypothetical protein